jgi:PAS domain S-box-containing protein
VNIVTVDRDMIAVVANDITPEVRAHLGLERERAQFASLIARSSDLACVVNAAGDVIYAPPRGTDFLGFTKSDMGAPLSRVTDGDREAATAWFDEIRSLRTGTEARSVALRFIASDGTVHTCDVTAENRSDDTSIGGIVLNAHDVSALIAAEGRLAAVADASADVIAICEEDGTIIWISSAVRESLGMEPDDLVGVSGFEIIHPDDLDRAATQLLGFVGDRSRAQPIDLRVRRGDGSYRWFECSANNQIDDPVIHGLVVSLRDSTNRRAAESALRISEERNRSIVEAAADAIISVDESRTASSSPTTHSTASGARSRPVVSERRSTRSPLELPVNDSRLRSRCRMYRSARAISTPRSCAISAISARWNRHCG